MVQTSSVAQQSPNTPFTPYDPCGRFEEDVANKQKAALQAGKKIDAFRAVRGAKALKWKTPAKLSNDWVSAYYTLLVAERTLKECRDDSNNKNPPRTPTIFAQKLAPIKEQMRLRQLNPTAQYEYEPPSINDSQPDLQPRPPEPEQPATPPPGVLVPNPAPWVTELPPVQRWTNYVEAPPITDHIPISQNKDTYGWDVSTSDTTVYGRRKPSGRGDGFGASNTDKIVLPAPPPPPESNHHLNMYPKAATTTQTAQVLQPNPLLFSLPTNEDDPRRIEKPERLPRRNERKQKIRDHEPETETETKRPPQGVKPTPVANPVANQVQVTHPTPTTYTLNPVTPQAKMQAGVPSPATNASASRSSLVISALGQARPLTANDAQIDRASSSSGSFSFSKLPSPSPASGLAAPATGTLSISPAVFAAAVP